MVRASALVAALLGGLAVAEELPFKGHFSNAELLQKLSEVTAEFEQLKAEVAHEHELKVEQADKSSLARGSKRARGSRRLTTALSPIDDLKGAMDHMWLLLCGALVMFMQAGFALLEAGACRAKNVQNILMKNLTDVCSGTLCWWAFGWMFAYGPIEGKTRFAGNTQYFGHDMMQEPSVGVIEPSNDMLNWFFQWAFCSAAATIVSGGIAERVNFPSYLLYTIWMTTIIYPIVVSWTWASGGWLTGGTEQQLNDVGYMDFAGSGIVHMCGGVGALTAAVVVGPRVGRWDPAMEDQFNPHSLPLVVLGTFILWFGWYGFNCGSTLGLSSNATGQLAASVAMNTTIAAATGGLTILGLRFGILKKYDIGGMCNGILAGLVSITAGCGNVECGSALVIGALGALVYQGASLLLRKLKIDDPLDAFPVHGACGAWGTLAAVIFDWGDGIGIFHGWSGFECVKDGDTCMDGARGKAFVANLVGVICIAAWSGLLSAVVLVPLKLAKLLRADDNVQESGLDTAKHSPAKAYAVEHSVSATPSTGKKEDA